VNAILEGWYRAHPVKLPLCLALGGFGAFGWMMFGANMTGIVAPLSMALMLLIGAGGLLTLPFGVLRWTRRQRNPVVLQCPKCSARSSDLVKPFTVTRWPDVGYAYVQCSGCGADWTIDKYARTV
jgi:hypothetical protein